MEKRFLLYGSTGFVGRAIARAAVERELEPILGGRDADSLRILADELELEARAFSLNEPEAIKGGLSEVDAVLSCAGPFVNTYQPLVEACLRTGTHYLDLTGEIPVYQELSELDLEARSIGVMILPGVGFDVVPTDCLALYLKQRLPTANRIALAFHIQGPAGFPPGTVKTAIDVLPYGDKVRREGRIVTPKQTTKTRMVDFGRGPVEAMRLPWGDVFMAYHSTGIPNIEDYAVFPKSMRRLRALFNAMKPLFKLGPVRGLLKALASGGSTREERARSRTSVWGEVEDDQGRRASARLHGPEAGVDWTKRAALTVVERVLADDAPPGFQTPAKAYGADFVLATEGVTREDVK